MTDGPALHGRLPDGRVGYRRLLSKGLPWVPHPVKMFASRMLGLRTNLKTERELARAARSNATIIVGPWLGEIGFELLYWIPFLAWATSRFQIDRRKVVAISRGGPELWYQHVAHHYHDVFDYLHPDDFRQANEQRRTKMGEQKQMLRTDLDEEVLERVISALGVPNTVVVHPSLMYRLYRRFWWGHTSRDSVCARARFETFNQPKLDAILEGLPPRFVAVKFYFNDCFPSTETNRTFVNKVVDLISQSTPVVSLSTGLTLDEHMVHELPDHQNISHLVEARTNLEIQSAIVAHAQAFVGTYGGFSYLAPFLKVPSIGIHSRPEGFARTHYDLALTAFEKWGPNLLRNLNVTAPDAIAELLAGARP